MGEYLYRAENIYGAKFTDYRRENVIRWYADHNGCKIMSYTKDLFPTYNVFVDEPNVDIRKIREEEDIVNKTSQAQRNAVRKYDAKATTQVCLKLNNETDKDILEFLDSSENKQGIIKELIRKEIYRNTCN